MAAAERNESAASFAWLAERLHGPAQPVWAAIREEMLARRQAFVHLQDWISDIWIARSSTVQAGILAPQWVPPEHVDDWPVLTLAAGSGLQSRQTNYASYLDCLQRNSSSVASDHGAALDEFDLRERQIGSPGDVRMIQGEHVRAWLNTALGNLLKAVALTPDSNSDVLVSAAFARLSMPLQFELPPVWANDFEERRLDLLYDLRLDAKGQLVSSNIRSGQGEMWREHWQWLSCAIGAQETLESLQVSARLMRCEPLVTALLDGLKSPDEYLHTVALAVVRRWLLTLRAMAWLETALQHPWESVRAPDLSCFAFNAVKPEWPRRHLGISHRSADVKAALIQMRAWQSSRCAIDANYVPSWETNTGMMWGLFAAPPTLARITSPRYLQSIWCRRESELIDYLVQHGDYLSSRVVIDVDETSMPQLDGLLPAEESPGLFNSFPPLCQVWVPTAMPEWEVRMLRAAAALRILHVFIREADLANRVAVELANGYEPPAPAFTNNPDGWRAYGKIFADLRALTGSEQLPLRLPATYGAEQLQIDTALADRIPDLSSGSPALADILVALEWFRVEWPAILQQGRGDFLLIDCQRLTREDWSSNEQVSLLRGLAAMRTEGPMWFLQFAGQEVENWPFVGERPIFTEHVSSQFAWMLPTWLERRESQALYPSASGLEFSPELAQRCAGPAENQG